MTWGGDKRNMVQVICLQFAGIVPDKTGVGCRRHKKDNTYSQNEHERDDEEIQNIVLRYSCVHDGAERILQVLLVLIGN